MDLTEAKARAWRARHRHRRECRQARQGRLQHRQAARRPEIEHYHQAIALVVAETFEQARAAAQLVRVEYVRARVRSISRRPRIPRAARPKPADRRDAVGDFAGAFAAAPVQLDATYTTPDQSHAMMEPHASIAAWEGDKLTLWTSNQMIDWRRGDLAKTLGIPKEKVRLMSPYIGGGFGGKAFPALRCGSCRARRARRRPAGEGGAAAGVDRSTTRPIGPRPSSASASAPTSDGKITAIGHESWSGDLPGGGPENAVQQTRLLYAGANRMTAMRLAVLDLPEGNAMRAPGEAPGLMALEIAMDEMAEKLGIDPVEFRILNDTQVDAGQSRQPPTILSQAPACDRSRLLAAQLSNASGAERFGWNKRKPRPGRSATDAGWSAWASLPRSATTCSPSRPRGCGSTARHRDGRDRHDRHRHRQLHDHRPDRRRDDGRAARQGRRCGSAIRASRSRPARAANGAPTTRRPASMRPASSCARRWRRSSASTRPRRCSRTARSARAIAACRSPRPQARRDRR